MIRVAIADDSPFTCNLLASYLEAGGECKVVGVAHDAPATLNLIRESTPDVLTLDLQMPGTDGLELLRQVGAEQAVSVVVISGVTRLAAATTLRALELGAVDFILKYTPGAPVSRASLRREIVSKVKIAAAAKPAVRQRKPIAAAPMVASASTITPATAARPAAKAARPDAGGLVVIGASTGGPKAIGEVLSQLPDDFSLPCVVVQHLPADFTQAFAAQIERHTRLQVKVAETGDRPAAGTILIAPGSLHLLFAADGNVLLKKPEPSDIYRPSINAAMHSAAEAYGAGAIGVVLTGAGDDGAEGLRAISDAGGELYVQEPQSCVVASMPERAIDRAGADHVAVPERIGQFLAVRRKP
ncbi:MAG: chemotaxis protein CheB [Cyanobacteria bacterium]|nr:chemotaxis protein CheB [Cyanobacteriota bacterium]